MDVSKTINRLKKEHDDLFDHVFRTEKAIKDLKSQVRELELFVDYDKKKLSRIAQDIKDLGGNI